MALKISFKLAGMIGLIMLTSERAWSVGGEGLPSSALPEQVSKSLSKEQPAALPAPPQITSPKKQESSPLGPEAEKIKFKLNSIVLEGNTVYTAQQLMLLYKENIGKTISVAELFNIAQKITYYYRNNGYVISRAILPPQNIKNGVVHIKIIEGFIGNVDVSGHPKGAKYLVNAYGNEIKKHPPLQINRMEKYLLLANEIPGARVRGVLSPSKTTTGATDLTLVTEMQTITGYISYDNYGTRYVGPQQWTGNLGFNSLIASGDATQFTYVKTPKGRELNYADLNYTLPIGGTRGIRWQFGGTRTHTHPLFVLRPSQIDGLTKNYYTTMNFPIIRTRGQTLTLRSGFNYLDSQVTIFREPLYTDHLRSLDLGGTYDFVDRWYGANLISADFRQGLPVAGYTSKTDPATAQTSRPGGRGRYSKITLQMSRLQSIKGPFFLYGAFNGQWAFNPLLASEQFTFGGPQLGRGYDAAEIIGDKGAAGSLELRGDFAIHKFLLRNIQFYVFYDIGAIWNKEVNATSLAKVTAATTGIGTRFFFTKYVSGNLMWTQPLTRQVAAEKLIGNGKKPRVFFSLVTSLN
jgi:hemolysin activation/secretion protein